MIDNVLNKQFGEYRLVEFIGKGNYSRVYRAEHIEQGTQVAVKVLTQPPIGESHEDSEQFHNEAKALQWVHPNIIRIRDAGISNGHYYLIMDLAPRGSMRKQHPRGTQLAWETVVGHVQQIADGLQYIHDHGQVHRDIKPENLLIGAKGEILLSDFGLTVTSYTWDPAQLQQAQGTPLYIAPEQIESHAVRESDQYALGVLMFEWLAGRAPFEGHPAALLYMHTSVQPPSLRTLVPTLPPQAAETVMKLLEKKPQERFASMRELVATLARVQMTTPVLKSLLYNEHNDSIRAVAWSPNGLYIASAGRDKVVRVWEVATGKTLCTHAHTGEIWSIAWSPDSRAIASVGTDKLLHIWRSTTGELIITYRGHTRTIYSVAWSSDGRYIATASEDETVRVWKRSASTDKPIRIYRMHNCWVYSVAWSPNSQHLASGGEDGAVHLWTLAKEGPLHICRDHRDRVMSVAWSSDGEYVASGSDDRSITIWQAAAGEKLRSLSGHTDTIASIAWSPVKGEQVLLSGSWDQTISVYHKDNDQPQATYKGHLGWVTSVSWSPEGNYFASGSWDQTIRIWKRTHQH